MTGPMHVISRWERIKRYTVWHPLNTDPLDDDRWTVRVWLPLYDVLAVLAGLIAFYVGSPLMNRLFPGWIVDGTAVAFAIAGAITLIGVVVPRAWRVEIGGKVTMSFLMTTYAMLVLTFPSKDGQSNAFVTVILVMATWGIYPRLTKLFIRGYQASKARKAMMA